MSYYQKYRPGNFSELDLASVRTAFEAVMESGSIAHAYLFVGPRGSGKTSSARILSRLVNCQKNYAKGGLSKKLAEPCGECDACVSIKNGSAVDVMEIDAASHRGIDDIRDLRDKVNLAAASLPKKVYIIDEVHMLTTEAFNALLKTLEEPPAHVMFILCTTEAHKVPETITSRCTRINFSRGRVDELVASLSRAAKGEGLAVDDEALAVIAAGVDGSFREGHKLLEQLVGRCEKITAADVAEVMSLVGGSGIDKILALVDAADAKGLTSEFRAAEETGVDPLNLLAKLLEKLKQLIRAEVAEGKTISRRYMRLVNRLVKAGAKVRISPLPLLPLEMVLVSEAMRGKSKRVVNEVAEKPVEKVAAAPARRDPARVVEFERIVSGWQELLSRLAPRNHSVAGLLRSARPKELSDKFLTIEVFYKFHKDQLEQEARRRIVEEEIAKLWGPISVRCILSDSPRNKASARPVIKVSEAESLAAAEEVFGV